MTNLVFSEENILITDIQMQNKTDLFAFIAKNARKFGYVTSEEECFKGLVAREEQQTTGFQDGFAIPHCKSATVYEPKIFFIKTSPIIWDSLDGEAITDSFALLIPTDGATEHLKLLAKIARSLIDKNYRTQLKQTKDQEKLFELISNKLEV